MTARRLWAFRWLAAGLACVGVLLLSELCLRLLVAFDLPNSPNGFAAFMKQVESAPVEDRVYRTSDDPALGYELVPGSRRGPVRINAHGFRGPEVAEVPPEGVVRIAFIGDSETFGARLAEAETLPGAVEQLLGADAGRERYEALNFGVPGYNTAQEFQALRTRVLRFQPRVVVLYYVLNDPEIHGRAVLLGSTALSRSYVYMFVSWFARARGAGLSALKQAHPDIIDYYRALHDSAYFETASRLIREMARELDARGIGFLLVIAPEIYGYPSFSAYPYAEIHDALRALASEQVKVIDPLPDLAAMGRSPSSLWVAPGDPHKNAAATRVIAARIAAQIRAMRR